MKGEEGEVVVLHGKNEIFSNSYSGIPFRWFPSSQTDYKQGKVQSHSWHCICVFRASEIRGWNFFLRSQTTNQPVGPAGQPAGRLARQPDKKQH